jgi:hypothetical protein
MINNIRNIYITLVGRYLSRKIMIIDIPNKYLFNNNKWLTMSSNVGYPDCGKCAFYYSTGTSNTGKANFPDVWFPFLRIKEDKKKERTKSSKERGWIRKACGLHDVIKIKEILITGKIKYDNFMILFLTKFSHWWQLQISAAMSSDSMWNTHTELIKLKALVLNNDYFLGKDLLSCNNNISNIIVSNEILIDSDVPENINKWLLDNGALCEENDEWN